MKINIESKINIKAKKTIFCLFCFFIPYEDKRDQDMNQNSWRKVERICKSKK